MNDATFCNMFFEYVESYADNPEVMECLRQFLSYGWGEISQGHILDATQEEKRGALVTWMVNHCASLKAIKAVIDLIA